MISRTFPILGSIVIWSIACAVGWQATEAFRDSVPYAIRPVPDVDTASEGEEIETATRPDTVDLSVALARPLFAPDRRPLTTSETFQASGPSQSIAETTQSDILPEVIVYGVALHGALSKALLSINDSVPDWYEENDIIAGWTLTKIQTNGVLLQSDTSELRIELY